MLQLSTLALLLFPGFPGGVPGAVPSSSQDESSAAFPEIGLTLKLPELEGLARKETSGENCKGEWEGRLGASEVHILFHVLPTSTYDFVEPEDVVESWRDTLRDPKSEGSDGKASPYSFGRVRAVAGPVGASPILAISRADVSDPADSSARGLLFLAGGLVPDNGWSLQVEVRPAPDEAGTKSLEAQLEKCASYSGKARDAKWTDAEALAFWKAHAPESTFKKFEKPVRTEHFIVLTNSTSPGPFVKKLEGKYAAIRKVLPFEDLPGRRLLPILLFRTDDDFQAFYRREFQMEMKDEVREGSVVRERFFATSCDNDDDHEDLLDLMKLVLKSRQRGWGGCRWFQDGLREYVASKPNERQEALRAVKKGKFTPLAKLLENEAWRSQGRRLRETGASDEADYWEQAALWMEFLHTGAGVKDKFPRFVETVGSVPDGDTPAVVAAIESAFGTDLMTLEKKWVEYSKKR